MHHKYAHNAVCCMSRKVKFSLGGGGGGEGGEEGGRTWPPLSEFSGSAPAYCRSA